MTLEEIRKKLENKDEWQIRQMERMLGDKRNKGKKRTKDVKEKRKKIMKGNQNRKGNDNGPLYIDLISKFKGTSLQVKDKFKIPASVGIKYLAKKRRLIHFDNFGRMTTFTLPDEKGFCIVLYEDYLKDNSIQPTFEYPFIKEANSGFIGTPNMIREKWPKWTSYHLDRDYQKGKYKNNPYPECNFITVSKKISTKRFTYPLNLNND